MIGAGPLTRAEDKLWSTRDLLRAAGVCPLCAVGMAIAAAERAEGRLYDWRTARGTCARRIGGTCEERAVAAWTAAVETRKSQRVTVAA